MPHVRRRDTKAGSVSTALVESYRDELGRPRQRLIANLHGQPDTLSALAKLEVMRKHKDENRAEYAEYARTFPDDDGINAIVLSDYDDDLAAMETEMSIIKKHCSASPDEIQVAIKAHEIALDDAVAIAQGCLMYKFRQEDALKAYKAKLRRMRT
jgi:hypothetical protein